jgi:hypothetical protein
MPRAPRRIVGDPATPTHADHRDRRRPKTAWVETKFELDPDLVPREVADRAYRAVFKNGCQAGAVYVIGQLLITFRLDRPAGHIPEYRPCNLKWTVLTRIVHG